MAIRFDAPFARPGADLLEAMLRRGQIDNPTFNRIGEIQDQYQIDVPEAVDMLRKELTESKRISILNAQKRKQLFEQQDASANAGQFVTSTVTKNLGESNGLSNVEYRGKAINGMFEAEFVPAMQQLSTKYAGVTQDRETARNMVRYLMDGAEVPAHIREWSDIWKKTSERARNWFNKVGGDIKKLDKWHMPQSHHAGKIKAMGRESWVQFTKDLLDMDEMQMKWGPLEDIDDILGGVWETIVSNGMNKVDIDPLKATPPAGKSKARTKQDPRFLQFKDADSWLKYNDQVGNPDIYATMKDHLRSMSDDIALMEILGPNPEANFHDLQMRARQKGQAGYERSQQNMYNVVSGKVDSTEVMSAGSQFLGASSGLFRSIGVASKLGSAMVSAISDPIFTMLTAGFNGIPMHKVIGKGIWNAMREMTSIDPQSKVLLSARLGIVSDAFSGSLANSRYAESASGKMQNVAGGVLRLSGLNAWTNAWRSTFSLEFMGVLSDNLGKNLDDIGALGKTLKKYGITQEDWNKISQANPIDDSNDGRFFSAIQLSQTEPDLAIRMLEMINEELDYAVLMPDARIRSLTTGGAEKGTMKGEMSRLFWMFKSFPLTVLTHHVGRIMFGQMDMSNRIAYAGAMAIGTTLIGTASLQLREMLKGKEPREITPGVLVQGAMQGGALGIFGDLILQDTTRYGNGLASTMMGPAVGTVENVYDMVKKNVDRKLQGKDTHLGSDAVRFLQSNIPGQNLWYTRLLLERSIFDNVKQMVDPKYHKKIRKQTRDMKKNYNQDWWWKPGT